MKDKKIRVFNKNITSKDVAKLAGVSQSSVSRTFNNPNGRGVGEEIRKKVLEAANELGYKPNLIARGMISRKTNIVGLVVGDALGPFYNRIINLFVEKLQEKGKHCLVFQVARTDNIEKIIETVIQFQVDGVIITASAMNRIMAETIIENDIPVILFNRFIPGIDISMVYADPVAGASKVADYLHEKGHENIGYIQYRETSEEIEKKVGFYSQLRKYGIFNVQEEYSKYDYREGYEAAKRLLSKENRPTAIFCTSDLIALGAIDAAKNEFNLKIPEEIAIVGYDDIEMASWESYSLTTVRQPVEYMINKTVEIIDKKLKDIDEKNEIKMIEPELIKRKTV